MKLYKIFIPKRDNNKKVISVDKMRKITEQIRQRFGGYSFHPSVQMPVISGVWTEEDMIIYREPVQLIELFVEDTFDNQKWMRAFKEMTRQDLDQKEIFIIMQDAEIVF